MEQASLSSRRLEEPDFNSRDGFLKARITRENTNSRRFSASNIPSFREETRSFRQSTAISSTASSPGYSSRDLIDPSTYSFTAAIKALQERSGWEYLSSIKSICDGNALNSKWYEAEKYISNPLSGQVPMECLSAKTLSGRCISNSGRITKSAPLIFSNPRFSPTMPEITYEEEEEEEEEEPPIPEMEKKDGIENYGVLTRDVGTQSTPPDLLSSSSTSPATTPSIKVRSFSSSLQRLESPRFQRKPRPKQEELGWMEKQMEGQRGKKEERWKCRFGGCLALGSWQKKQKKKWKDSTIDNPSRLKPRVPVT